ncbi:unnamed protein product [Closterium sp. NIES-53]
MELRSSSVPLQVPLPSPLTSSFADDPDLESYFVCAASPTLVHFPAACRLDYTASLVAESASASPLSVGGECALGTDVLKDRQEDIEHPDPALLRRGDYGVKRPPGSLPVFKARYVARGLRQGQGVHFFRTFSPTPKMTTLRVLLHISTQRDYELHSLDLSTAFLQGSLHEEIWLRRPPGFTGSFPVGTQWSLRRLVYGLRQALRERHETLRTTLAALGFAPSTADPSLFLHTNTLLPRFYILVYVDDLVFATADTEALALVKSELQKRHTCTDLGPSALRLPVLLATIHSFAYRSLALSTTFGGVHTADCIKN